MKVIIITFQSYHREVIPFSLAALKYIEANQCSIAEFDIVEFKELPDTEEGE